MKFYAADEERTQMDVPFNDNGCWNQHQLEPHCQRILEVISIIVQCHEKSAGVSYRFHGTCDHYRVLFHQIQKKFPGQGL